MEPTKPSRAKRFQATLAGVVIVLTVILVGCSLSGCSGGGGGGGEAGIASNLPPDPGAAGKATLAGVDSDGDGVRDDIQRYIALTYPDSAKTREELTRYAKVAQSELLDSKDRPLSVQHAKDELVLQQCFAYAVGSVDKSAAISDELIAKYLNTRERSDAYLAYDHLVGSLGTDEPSLLRPNELKQACSYLDVLPN